MFDELLAQRASLEYGTVTRTSTGEETTDWSVVNARVPVLVRPARVPADMRPGEIEAVSHVIFCRPIEELTDTSRRRWRMVVSGSEYVLIEPHDAGARGHHLEIRARRL